jgi:hypothetical protein
MSKTEREYERHAAGGPGKSARKGHLEPEKSGNKPGQRQAGAERLPGARLSRGPERHEPDTTGSAS